MAQPAGGWSKEDWDRYLYGERGYPLQGNELWNYYRMGHPFARGHPNYPTSEASQYPLTPMRLEDLIGDLRTRNWIQFVLSQMGFMSPGYPQPRYSMFRPQPRRPTMFTMPQYGGSFMTPQFYGGY